MKKVLIVISLLLSTIAAQAQFERGKMMINTSLTGLNLSYSENDKGQFGMQAAGGYFIFDDFALTTTIGMQLTDPANAYSFGVGGRYYFKGTGFHIGGEVKAISYTYKDAADVNDFALCPEAGYTFFLSHSVAIEPGVYTNVSLKNSDYTKFGFKLGFSFFF